MYIFFDSLRVLCWIFVATRAFLKLWQVERLLSSCGERSYIAAVSLVAEPRL